MQYEFYCARAPAEQVALCTAVAAAGMPAAARDLILDLSGFI
jgi:hypothetical protein